MNQLMKQFGDPSATAPAPSASVGGPSCAANRAATALGIQRATTGQVGGGCSICGGDKPDDRLPLGGAYTDKNGTTLATALVKGEVYYLIGEVDVKQFAGKRLSILGADAANAAVSAIRSKFRSDNLLSTDPIPAAFFDPTKNLAIPLDMGVTEKRERVVIELTATNASITAALYAVVSGDCNCNDDSCGVDHSAVDEGDLVPVGLTLYSDPGLKTAIPGNVLPVGGTGYLGARLDKDARVTDVVMDVTPGGGTNAVMIETMNANDNRDNALVGQQPLYSGFLASSINQRSGVNMKVTEAKNAIIFQVVNTDATAGHTMTINAMALVRCGDCNKKCD